MNGGTLREHLKNATRERHAALDAFIGSLDTPDTYRGYLRGISAFRMFVEERLAAAPWPDRLGDWQPVRLSEDMKRDLEDLALHAPSLDLALDLPSADSTLGALYVLEGSTLGARILAKQVAALGFDETFGARHLARQAAAVQNWRAFVAGLDQHSSIDETVASRAACRTFDVAHTAMRMAFQTPFKGSP